MIKITELLRDRSLIIRMIYALCLLGATYAHIRTHIKHGLLFDYYGAPLLSCIYWTSLTFFDPLAALLLLIKPRAGLVLTATIIVSDVLHNSWMILQFGGAAFANAYQNYIAQVTFLIFIGLTIRTAWRDLPSRADA